MIAKLPKSFIESAKEKLDSRLAEKVDLKPAEEQLPLTPSSLTVDSASRAHGLGGEQAGMYSVFSGYNILNTMAITPTNTDNIGYTFFTRPRLNLSYDNVIKSRILSALADRGPHSTANAMRWMLTVSGLGDLDGDLQKSALFSDGNPFITLLSNSLISMPSMQDFTPDIYTSSEGFAREQMGFIDDKPYMYRAHSMTLNFANMQGDPITTFFYIWTLYATCVAYGIMAPFPKFIINNRIDYQTGIYRFTMDPSRRYVQNTAKTIGFPTVAPIGAIFSFDRANQLNRDAEQVGINFQCFGLEVNDPITIYEFNKEVVARNPKMALNNRNSFMKKLTEVEKTYFNYKAIPYIEPDRELTWWIDRSDYEKLDKEIYKGDANNVPYYRTVT